MHETGRKWLLEDADGSTFLDLDDDDQGSRPSDRRATDSPAPVRLARRRFFSLLAGLGLGGGAFPRLLSAAAHRQQRVTVETVAQGGGSGRPRVHHCRAGAPGGGH